MAAEHGCPPGLEPRLEEHRDEGGDNYHSDDFFDCEDYVEAPGFLKDAEPSENFFDERLPQSYTEDLKGENANEVYLKDAEFSMQANKFGHKGTEEIKNFTEDTTPSEQAEPEDAEAPHEEQAEPESAEETYQENAGENEQAQVHIISIDGKSTYMDYDPNGDGRDLRLMIADRLKLPAETFRMNFGSKPILDDDALKNLGFDAKTVARVEIYSRLLGGVPPPAPFTALTVQNPTDFAAKLNELVGQSQRGG